MNRWQRNRPPSQDLALWCACSLPTTLIWSCEGVPAACLRVHWCRVTRPVLVVSCVTHTRADYGMVLHLCVLSLLVFCCSCTSAPSPIESTRQHGLAHRIAAWTPPRTSAARQELEVRLSTYVRTHAKPDVHVEHCLCVCVSVCMFACACECVRVCSCVCV